MTLALYDEQKPGNCAKVGLVLKKPEIPYCWHYNEIFNPQMKTPCPPGLNDAGQVRVIGPNDRRPPDATRASMTCAAGATDLIPGDRYGRDDTSRWLYWKNYSLEPRLVAAMLAVGLCVCALAGHVLAWGATGHRLIGRLAVAALPADVPRFLRTSDAVEAEGELAREPDRWKGSGKVHDADRDAAHFLDLDDDAKVLGGPPLADLPPTRADYDAALRSVGSDSWKAGYLPYAIVDGWQQLVRDFAYWRVDDAAARGVADLAHRAWFARDRLRREALLLRDLGTLAHYVGDGSQPMHVSVHFNGWGAYANPDGFTQERVHAPFEGAFVRAYVTQASVRAQMAAYQDCACDIQARVRDYLRAANLRVRPLYQLYKDGGFDNGDARGRAFAAERLAAAATELRDEIVDAWRASASADVGWPAVKVADVLAGKLDPFDALYGAD